MKRIALAAAAALMFAGAASAADMPMKAPPPVPVVAPPVWTWTGFYVGGNVGYLVESDNTTTTFTQPGTDPITTQSQPISARSFVGGVQGGYNWQIASWVVGVEADWDWTDPKNTICRQTDRGNCFDGGNNNRGALTFSTKTEWLGSVRGRVGWTMDHWFLYATGGGAWGRVDSTLSASCLNGGCGNNGTNSALTASFGNNRSGWVAGLGAEVMVTQNLTARVEWLHYDLGNLTTSVLAAPAFGSYGLSWSRSPVYDTFRVGANYKFNWGAPLVAKY